MNSDTQVTTKKSGLEYVVTYHKDESIIDIRAYTKTKECYCIIINSPVQSYNSNWSLDQVDLFNLLRSYPNIDKGALLIPELPNKDEVKISISAPAPFNSNKTINIDIILNKITLPDIERHEEILKDLMREQQDLVHEIKGLRKEMSEMCLCKQNLNKEIEELEKWKLRHSDNIYSQLMSRDATVNVIVDRLNDLNTKLTTKGLL